MQNVVPLPGVSSASREIGHYIRLGDTGHKILEDLVAEGRFPVERVVVDASRHKQQAHLIEALIASDGGVELILDTKCAELAALGKYDGVAKEAPSGALGGGQPMDKDLFPIGRHSEVLQRIAEFATAREIDLLGQTPAGRRLVACKDRDCCENGLRTMLENPRRHLIRQATAAIHRMEAVPPENRPRDFLGGTFSDELRAARQLAKLQVHEEKLGNRLEKNSRKMGKLHSALDKLATERENSSLRPRQVPRRASKHRNVGKNKA